MADTAVACTLYSVLYARTQNDLKARDRAHKSQMQHTHGLLK